LRSLFLQVCAPARSAAQNGKTYTSVPSGASSSQQKTPRQATDA
jgi:hypothetical protein